MKPWYSVDTNGKVIEHGTVSLDRAIAIAERYLGHTAGARVTANAETESGMFGFGTDGAFVEFGIISETQISWLLEIDQRSRSWWSKLLGSVFQRKGMLTSRDELVGRIREFYAATPEELMSRYR